MSKEDFIRKITSRKFWVAVVSFVTALLIAFKVPEASISQVAAIIMAFGSLFAYIFAEGWVDSTRAKDGGGNSYINYWGDKALETVGDDEDESKSDH